MIIKKIKSKLLYIAAFCAIVTSFMMGSAAHAASETYTWNPTEPKITAQGGIYSSNNGGVVIEAEPASSPFAGKWYITSDSQLSFSGSKCTVGARSGMSPLFSVDTSKNTISYAGSWAGSDQPGYQSCARAMGSNPINGGTISGKSSAPVPTTPTSCGSYSSDPNNYAACRQGQTFLSNDNGNATTANSDCDKVYPAGAHTAENSACKVGIQLNNMPALFTAVRTAACKDETGGTSASCQSSFDAALQKCIVSGNADLSAVKACLVKVYPNLKDQINAVSTTTGDTKDAPSSCAVEGIGWIVCPIINFLSSVADNCFNFLADSFLKTDPTVFNTETPAYKAWSTVRNIANILFVIAFLFIVFSQLTGIGISNYGVKKMLPRIVIAAILVNVSYFIAQLAIDISNILGYSIRDFFGGLSDAVNKATNGSASNISDFATGGGGGFAKLAGVILATGLAVGTVYLLLSAFGPILLAVVIALVMILFILIARQALIVLLVVLSPIAFVAFLLPNTESLFKMWRKLLTTMLLLFPIIALVFGASAFASTLLQNSFNGAVTGDASNVFGEIIASAILILPLFAVPIILKKSLDGIPVLGSTISKWANRGFSNAGGKVKEGYRNSLIGRGNALRKNARQNYRDRRFAEKVSSDGFTGAVAGLATKGVNRWSKQGKYVSDTIGRVAEETAEKALDSDINAAAISLKNKHINPDTQIKDIAAELEDAALHGDKVRARAAQSILLNSGGAGLDTLHRTLESITRQDSKVRNSEVGVSLRNALNSAGIKGKDNALASWAYSDTSLEKLRTDAGTFRSLSSTELGGQRLHVLQAAVNAKDDNGNPITVISAAQAQAVLSNENVMKDMDPGKRAIFEELAKRKNGSTAAATSTQTYDESTAAGRARATADRAATGTVGDGTFVVDHAGDTNHVPPTTPPKV